MPLCETACYEASPQVSDMHAGFLRKWNMDRLEGIFDVTET